MLAQQHHQLADAVEASICAGSDGDAGLYERRLVAALCLGHSCADAVSAPGGVEAAVAAADVEGRLAVAIQAEGGGPEPEEAYVMVAPELACECGSRTVLVCTKQTRSADEVRILLTPSRRE